MSAKYTRIPVVLNFDYNAPIGELVIDTSQLPKTADFCLAISYIAGNVQKEEADTYSEIVLISPVQDSKYAAYLEYMSDARNNNLQ